MNIFEAEIRLNSRRSEDEENGYRVVECRFSEIQEQTIEKQADRCLYKGEQIKVLTQGGHEYLIPFNLEINQVFPIDNGIMIVAKYSEEPSARVQMSRPAPATAARAKSHFARTSDYLMDDTPTFSRFSGDMLNFEQGRPEAAEAQDNTLAYFTVTGHPLNDVKIVGHANDMLVATKRRLLYCTPQTPFVVLHDPISKQLEFGMLKRTQEAAETEEAYIETLLPSSRHPSLSLCSRSSEIHIENLWRITSTSCPDAIVASCGCGSLQDSDLVFQVFYQCDHQLAFIRLDLGSLGDSSKSCFKVEEVLQNVTCISPVDFLPRYDILHLMAKSPLAAVQPAALKYLKQSIKSLSSCIAVAQSTNPDRLQIYKGLTKIWQTKVQGDIIKLDASRGSFLTLKYSNRSQTRQKIEVFLQNEYLITAFIKIFSKILPEKLFISLYQDIIKVLMENTQGQTSFESVATLLLTLVSGNSYQTLAPSAVTDASGPEKPKLGTIKTALITGSVNHPLGALGGQVKKTSQFSSSPHQVPVADPFTELLNSEFHHEFDEALFAPLPTSPTKSRPKSGTRTQSKKQVGQGSRTQNMLRPSTAGLATDSRSRAYQDYTTTLNTSSIDFQRHQKEVFRVLHYLLEDMLLDKLRFTSDGKKLAKLLTRWILVLAENDGKQALRKAAYLDYYLKEFPSFKVMYRQELQASFGGDAQNITWLMAQDNFVSIEHVPQIFKTLEAVLSNRSPIARYMLFFERSRKVLRTYQIMALRNTPSEGNGPTAILTANIAEAVQFPNLKKAAAYKGNLQAIKDAYHSSGANDSKKLKNGGQPRGKPWTSDEYLMTAATNGNHVFEKVLYCLMEEQLSLKQILALPNVVGLPILEIIRYCRLFLKEVKGKRRWPPALYRLIDREDVLNNSKLFQDMHDEAHEAISEGIDLEIQGVKRTLFQKQGSKTFALSLNRGISNVFDDQFELKAAEAWQDERLKLDSHFNEAMDSLVGPQAQPEADEPNPKSGQSDQSKFVEFLISKFSQDSRYKEVCHLLSSSKEMTLKIEKIPNHETLSEEHLKEAKAKLLDKLFARHLSKMVGRGLLTLGTQDTIPTEMLSIPRINTSSYVPALETSLQVEIKDDISKELLQWPEFHNGAASALKIAMSLQQQREKDSNFVRNWIMQHKSATPRSDHGGFLLTLGLFGLLDSLQKTDMYQHLKSIHDLTAIGILLGRAASKIGTMDTQDTRSLCMHISYLVPPNLFADISLPVQSAAIIGTGLLYKGTQYRQITEMLIAQIGRKPINDKSIEREVYALSSGIALGLVNLGAGPELHVQFGDLNIEERLLRFIEGGKIMDLPKSTQQASQYNEGQCSSIREGDQVNVHITSPGALFALCLIYLQSNNKLVAAKLQLPETFHQLESVRPAFLLQKVLCRSLILWDEITASPSWIQSQLPEIISFIFTHDIVAVEKKYAQQIGGECFDFACISLCYVNILSGAYLALGYKYAGTGDKAAFKLINDFVYELKRAKIATQMTTDLLHQIYTDKTKNLIDKQTQENCLCMCALAMSLVMAGTGDVQCFKTIRVIRKRLEVEMHYGHNMAINMALGFLFLGSGAFTLSRAPFSVAALMCALYPVFPADPNDNRFHLQALRHFWVMAIETRLVQARDIDTGEFVQVDVILNKNQKVRTPAVLNEEVESLELKNERYYPVSLKLHKGKIIQSQTKVTKQQKQHKLFNQSNLEQVIYIKKRNLQELTFGANEASETTKAEAQQMHAIVLPTDKTKKVLLVQLEQICREHGLTEEFIERVLKLQYLEARDRIQGSTDPSLLQFESQFASVCLDQRLGYAASLESLLLSGSADSSGHSFFDLEDAASHVFSLFEKHMLTSTFKQKIMMVVGLDQAKTQDRVQFLNMQIQNEIGMLQTYNLGEAVDNFIKDRQLFAKYTQRDADFCSELTLHAPPKHSEGQLHQVISSCGLDVLSDTASGASTASLDPHTIQTCHLLVQNFLNQLKQQGETALVQQFIKYVTQNQESPENQHAFSEIHKSLTSILRSVLVANGLSASYAAQILQGLL